MIVNVTNSARMKLYKGKRSIVKLIERYKKTPRNVKNWRLWACRRALSPWFLIHMWVITLNGERFFLGNDPIDDMILEEILGNYRNLYLPDKIATDREFLILDVGAHHGIVAVCMLLHFHKSFLIAVEPNPDAPYYLKKNFEENGLTERVEIVESALSPHDGIGVLLRGNKGSWADTVATKPLDSNTGELFGEIVPTKDIKSILKGRTPNLIKCNAEGAEYDLFPKLFTQKCYPDFVVLMAHPEYGSVDNLIKLFQKEGYRVFDVASSNQRPRLHCYRNNSPLIRDC